MMVDTGSPRTCEELLAEARSRFQRLGPAAAAAAQASGAVLVDIREDDQIRDSGSIPGAVRIPRNVLEWRADPASSACDARIAHRDLVLILVCQQGYQSSLAASSLHDLGFSRATDLEGGFEAWRSDGLPIVGGDLSWSA
jgi:rhodanese-related sulfurtransferase